MAKILFILLTYAIYFGQCRKTFGKYSERNQQRKIETLYNVNVRSFLDFNMEQVSTAISDFVLSISSFYGAGVIVKRYIHAAVGLIIIGLAAGVGTIRFLNILPLHRRSDVISLHSKLSWFGAILGEWLVTITRLNLF